MTKDHGSNVVQKGLASSAQWKLQIDSGGDGRTSCVVRITDGADPIMAKSTIGVADGSWHRIVCYRGPDTLEVSIEDVVTKTVPVPADSVIAPAGHLVTVGAKGAGPDNDQFHGELDDLFFARG